MLAEIIVEPATVEYIGIAIVGLKRDMMMIRFLLWNRLHYPILTAYVAGIFCNVTILLGYDVGFTVAVILEEEVLLKPLIFQR